MSNVTNLFLRILLLSILGIVISIYLIYHHENIVGGYNIGQSFCNIGGQFNCDDVAKSPYSEIFGIPVAALGFCYFFLLTCVSFYFASFYLAKRESLQNSALALVAISSLVAIVPSLFLLAISAFVIKKFCLFCLLLDLVQLCIIFLTFKFLKPSFIKEIPQLFSSLKLFLISFSFFAILLALSLPTAFRVFVLEAALKESVIGKLYDSWQKSPEVDLQLNFENSALTKDYFIGAQAPVVTIVEFSDFQCPFCQLGAKEVKSLVDLWPDKVRVVFKNFPLDKLCNLRFETAPHDLACQAAVIARCAANQNDANFWKFHDLFFNLPHEDWNLEKLMNLTSTENLDPAIMNQCIVAGQALQRVRQDVELGNAVGVNSTPSFFINGRRVTLSRLDQLKKIVEMILKRNPEQYK